MSIHRIRYGRKTSSLVVLTDTSLDIKNVKDLDSDMFDYRKHVLNSRNFLLSKTASSKGNQIKIETREKWKVVKMWAEKYFVISNTRSSSVALGVSSGIEVHFNLIGRHVDIMDVVGCCVELVAVRFPTHVTRRLGQTVEKAKSKQKRKWWKRQPSNQSKHREWTVTRLLWIAGPNIPGELWTTQGVTAVGTASPWEWIETSAKFARHLHTIPIREWIKENVRKRNGTDTSGQ